MKENSIDKNILNFIKRYWKVILIVLICFGLFYWFQLRPAKIRKDCIYTIAEKCLQDMGRLNCEDAYRACLLRNGVAK